MLICNKVCFAYGNAAPILQDVSLTFSPGERVALLGPSGYGKSTLAKLMAGYLDGYTGDITLDGVSIRKRSGYNPIQLIYQHPEQCLDPRWTLGKSLREAWDIPQELMQAMGVKEAWLSRFPHELSGGQLQRMSILRALSPQTKVLIADEITASLDPITQAQLWAVILKEVKMHNMTLITITHNAHLAKLVSDRTMHIQEVNHIGEQDV